MTQTKSNSAWARCTREFKLEAVRMLDKGESIAAASRSLAVVDQTLGNWVKLHQSGKLLSADRKPAKRMAAVLDANDFASAKHVAAFLGLIPVKNELAAA